MSNGYDVLIRNNDDLHGSFHNNNLHTVDFAPAYRISQSLMPFVCIPSEKRNSMLINRVEMLVNRH